MFETTNQLQMGRTPYFPAFWRLSFTGDIATCVETIWIRRTKKAKHGLLNGFNGYGVQENA